MGKVWRFTGSSLEGIGLNSSGRPAEVGLGVAVFDVKGEEWSGKIGHSPERGWLGKNGEVEEFARKREMEEDRRGEAGKMAWRGGRVERKGRSMERMAVATVAARGRRRLITGIYNLNSYPN